MRDALPDGQPMLHAGMRILRPGHGCTQTLRHSIGGAEEFPLPHLGSMAPQAGSRLGPATSLPVPAAAPPSPQQQHAHALAEAPPHAESPSQPQLQPAVSVPAPVQMSSPEPEPAMSPVPASLPIISGELLHARPCLTCHPYAARARCCARSCMCACLCDRRELQAPAACQISTRKVASLAGRNSTCRT